MLTSDKFLADQCKQLQEEIEFQVISEISHGLRDFNDQEDRLGINTFKAQMKKEQAHQLLVRHRIKYNTLTKKEFETKLKKVREEDLQFYDFDEEDEMQRQLGLIAGSARIQRNNKNLLKQEDRLEHMNEFKTQQDESKKLVIKLEKDRKERENRQLIVRQKEEKLQQLKEKEKLEEAEKEQKRQEELKEQRKLEILNKIEELKKRRDMKDQELKSQKLAYSQSSKNILRYEEMQKRFEQEILIPDLEEKKKKLQEIRELKKPIDFKEINKHSKKFDSLTRKQLREIESQRSLEREQLKVREMDIRNKFKSNVLDQVIIEERAQQQKMHNQLRVKQDQKDKIKNYYKYVKEIHAPTLKSEDQLRYEESERIAKLQLRHKMRLSQQEHSNKNNHLEILQNNKLIYSPSNIFESTEMKIRRQNLVWEKDKDKTSKRNQSQDQRIPYKDYLKENQRKRLNEDLGDLNYLTIIDASASDLNNRGTPIKLPPSKVSLQKVDNYNDRNMMLQEQINVIEEKFKMKNQQNKHGSKEDRELSKFILWNYRKGFLVSNVILLGFYLARFKNYRNSHLFKAQILMTGASLLMSSHGIFPIYLNHQFQKLVPLKIITDVEDFQKSTTPINDILSACYIDDLNKLKLQ
ncbi:UNKNOWN [Stylonychia lemnae]|uniref:Uncharacterized protein n=1 Tax=Stylonychia lemnae TaxID=5949 RepID=A0A078AJI5_STYLE|nr:UNKNOWN [Stylonychia lemnae]|eukprot:CDW82041.1 UNKNOWN [Stylonychia lemnae]